MIYLYCALPQDKYVFGRSGEESEEENGERCMVQLTYPLPPCSTDLVAITRGDISRLKPRHYLNDNIIDYFFKYVFPSVHRLQ